jgi:hypothetical protein
MNKETVVDIQNGVLFSPEKEWKYVNCRKVDGTGGHYVD